MYVEYSRFGDSVFVKDEKGIIKRFDNTNNFQDIIVLENEKCSSDNRILKEKKSQKKYKNYRNFICGMSFVSLTNAIYLSTVKAGSISPILTGALVLTTFATTGVMQGLVKTFDNKIKNIKIYQKALDKELKYELSKSKRVISKEKEKGFIDNQCSPLKLTYDKYDLMHQVIVNDYNTNGRVTFPLFDEKEKRIFNTMLEEENKIISKRKVKEI